VAGNFVCIAEGFPSIPFFVNTDLSRSDGIIQCREISTEEVLRLSWKLLRAIKIITGPLPIP